MAFLGMSDDFDLDDDGILRDSASSTGGFLIDNDGIVRDDLDLYKNTGHWTDSGFGGDKQSSTSTLRQLQTSFDDDSRIFDVDQSVNISELEASKDDLSFDRESVNSFDQDFQDGSRGNTSAGIVSNRSSLEKPQGVQHIEHNQSANKSKGDKSELFTEEYYQQLRDLGVLVDGADLSNTKDSVQDFEQLEAHLSRENIFDDTAQTDTIADFFRKENERQIQEQAYRSQEFTNGGENRFRPNSVASEQTLSSHSFPEVSPEEALMLYNVNRAEDSFDNGKFEYGNQRVVDATGLFHRVGDTSGIFQRSGDDDEIFFITSRMGSEAPMPNFSQNVSPAPYSPHSSRPTSRGSVYSSRSQTPYRDELQQSSTSLTDITRLGFNQSSVIHEQPDSPVKKEERQQLQTRPESANNQTKSRPSSVASHRSTVSEAPSSKTNQSDSSKQLSKARSEESFFEVNKTPRSSNEKMPKRLLPKPVEENQSFRMKSKSTTNISNRHGPIKPTHLSMSDLSRSGVDDGMEGEGDRSQGELTVKLKQEHLKRKQATELVQQLQKDYDSLLSKYAMAELTIDQMRLGAKITLHSDSPTPNQIQTGTLTAAQHPQVIQMGSAAHGVLSNSPAPGVAGHFSPQPDSLSLRDNRTPTSVSESWAAGRSDRGVGGDSRRPSITESEERGFVPQNVGAEKVKNELLQQAGGLNKRIESFNSLLEQRQLTLEEQEEVFENIRTDHEVLRRHYLQAKEDYNVLREIWCLPQRC
ncbi:microtubule organization protein AKNA-like [Haliotis rubra]|uniref:microtubule organization protein AKNA-like n=1 Tax=Haliotis rubra TaxID=36100 RepID=UPI001EE59A38|nr:microtubule organization protein AKNA-like [Haliotis rubra]